VGVQVPLRTHIKDTKIGRGDNLGHHCFWARSVGHPQSESAVQLGPIVRVGVAKQAEQVVERLGDRIELVAGYPLGWRFGEAEPGLRRPLHRGGFGDPAGDERRVAARVEGCPVAVDLSVGVGDDLAQLFDLAGIAIGGERGTVVRVGHAAEVVGQIPPG
jgi:hypothetical protein